MIRVLVVDDEKSIRLTLPTFLRKAGYETDVAEDAEMAQEKLAQKEYDIVISDIIMPRVTGMSLLKIIRAEYPQIHVIMMTGEPTVETASEAVRATAFDYLSKPVNKEQLLLTVGNAAKIILLEQKSKKLLLEKRAYQEKLEQLVSERKAEYEKLQEQMDEPKN